MLFDWSAECGPADAVLVVPWSDPVSGAHFTDLRDDPYALDEIPEAEAHPALAQALRALNAARSPVFTAKCDLWRIADADEISSLALSLMLDITAAEPLHACAGYIDLVWRDRTIFASFHQHQHILHRLERRIAALDEPGALVECVIRPAVLDFDTPQEGFAVSLYLKSVALTGEEATALWSRALAVVVGVFRRRDLVPHTATTSSPAE